MERSTTTAPRRRLRAAERRERILAAATEVFAESGYYAASMAEIARRAGVVASVIYDHFPSKRELHIELIGIHGDALIERTITSITPASPLAMLQEGIDVYFRGVEEDPFAWRFLFRDPPGDPEIAEAWRECHDRATEGIAALIRHGVPDLEKLSGMPPDRASRMLATLSQGASNGLARWWYEHREVPREEVADLARRALWDGFERMLTGDQNVKTG
jgi:AcrR family transcriptional regulator